MPTKRMAGARRRAELEFDLRAVAGKVDADELATAARKAASATASLIATAEARHRGLGADAVADPFHGGVWFGSGDQARGASGGKQGMGDSH